MMHKEIEVNVDDLIAKSREGESHIKNLQKLFERLRKFQLKLNPAKCMFGITFGKLLGFIVSEKRIEVDLIKFKQSRICHHIILKERFEDSLVD